jgi:hypothetical protein
MLNPAHLPRQARDKHRENSKKGDVLSQEELEETMMDMDVNNTGHVGSPEFRVWYTTMAQKDRHSRTRMEQAAVDAAMGAYHAQVACLVAYYKKVLPEDAQKGVNACRAIIDKRRGRSASLSGRDFSMLLKKLEEKYQARGTLQSKEITLMCEGLGVPIPKEDLAAVRENRRRVCAMFFL